jgi:chromosome partitioning protein
MAIIAVFNQKGGVGRTTTALNLLAATARRGRRPLGIDLDPQAHLSQVFGIRPRLADDSVCSFFARKRPLADVAQITRSGVALCPAHADLAKIDARLGRGGDAVTRLREALRQRDTPAEPVVIDCGPLLDVLSLNALFACDLVLVPVSCDYLSLRGASQVERALDALEPVFGQPPTRRYLLTRYCATRTISDDIVTRMAAAFRSEELCTTRIRECPSLAESPVMELDVFRHAPASDGAQDYAALDVELVSSGLAH